MKRMVTFTGFTGRLACVPDNQWLNRCESHAKFDRENL